MVPTVGRIVHYTNLGDADGKYPPEQQAAIITKVSPKHVEPPDHFPRECTEGCYRISLHIFYATGQFDMNDVPFSKEYARGHWTWPPKV